MSHDTKATEQQPVTANATDVLVQDLTTVYKRAGSVFQTSKQSLLGLVGYVQLQLMQSPKAKSAEIGQEIINQLQPIADALNTLNSVHPLLVRARETALAVREDSANTADTLSAVQSKFAMQQVRVPRPACVLLEGDVPNAFRNFPTPTYDTFTAVNSETSVLSRIRFMLGSNGSAVGVAVIASEEDVHGPQTRNLFEFDRFISFASRTIGRDLDINTNSGDQLFLYRTVVDLAVKLADAEVSAAGALVTILAEGGQAVDESGNPDDTISDALQQIDDTVDNQIPLEYEGESGISDNLDETNAGAAPVASDEFASDDMRELDDLFVVDGMAADDSVLAAADATDPDEVEITEEDAEVELPEDDSPVQLLDLDDPDAALVDGSPVFEIDPDLAPEPAAGPGVDLLDKLIGEARARLAPAASEDVGERVSTDGGDPETEDLTTDVSPFARFE